MRAQPLPASRKKTQSPWHKLKGQYGMIMMAAELLDRFPHPTETEIRQELARNLCRCEHTNRIIHATRRAAQASGRN
jgi:aerobic-type carbon monoxide dehydrogenase small subunit (CoxS/CutS family)